MARVTISKKGSILGVRRFVFRQGLGRFWTGSRQGLVTQKSGLRETICMLYVRVFSYGQPPAPEISAPIVYDITPNGAWSASFPIVVPVDADTKASEPCIATVRTWSTRHGIATSPAAKQPRMSPAHRARKRDWETKPPLYKTERAMQYTYEYNIILFSGAVGAFEVPKWPLGRPTGSEKAALGCKKRRAKTGPL